MLKYRFLYKEFLLRLLGLTLLYFLIMLLQVGNKKYGQGLDSIFPAMVDNNIFIAIQIIIPVFLMDIFYPIKSERIREKKFYGFILLEKILVVYLLCILIRIVGLGIYSLIVYHNLDFGHTLGRILLADLGTVLISYIITNLMINKYVSMFISALINCVMFMVKGLYYSVFEVNGDNFINIDYVYIISIIALFLVLFITRLWRCEYARNN